MTRPRTGYGPARESGMFRESYMGVSLRLPPLTTPALGVPAPPGARGFARAAMKAAACFHRRGQVRKPHAHRFVDRGAPYA